MTITQDVRENAASQKVEEERALAVRMADKAAEFKAMRSEIYHRLTEGGGENH